MGGFDFPVGLLFFARPLHGTELFLGKYDVFLGGLGFQCFQPLAEGLQIMTEPDAPHTRGGNEQTRFGQFVGHADLAPCWLVQGHFQNRFLDVVVNPVLGAGLASADLAQG